MFHKTVTFALHSSQPYLNHVPIGEKENQINMKLYRQVTIK